MFSLIRSNTGESDERTIDKGVFCIAQSESLDYLRFIADSMQKAGYDGGYWIDDERTTIDEL